MSKRQKASLGFLTIIMTLLLILYYNHVMRTETGQEQPLTLICVTCAADVTEGNKIGRASCRERV